MILMSPGLPYGWTVTARALYDIAALPHSHEDDVASGDIGD